MSVNQAKKKGRPLGSKNKPKLNIGGMPNDLQTQQFFTNSLEAKNIGVDKIILNINGGNSELQTNKNSILKYSLKEPIKLEIGDVITCIDSFVQEQGLAENTISFEEDIEAEMRFTYYKQGDLGDELTSLEDIGFCAYPKLFPDSFNDTENNRNDFKKNYLRPPSDYEKCVGDLNPNMDYDGIMYGNTLATNKSNSSILSGANGNYYYLMETIAYNKQLSNTSSREFTDTGKFGNQLFIRPCYGSKKIKVKAGNYSVDSLANIISSQLNGSLGADNNQLSDALLDKLYNPNGVNKNSMISTYPYFKNIDISDDEDQSDIIGNCGEKTGFERKIDGFI